MTEAKSINKLVENAYQSMILPEDTQKWVDALREKNLNKLRKLLKKNRDSLPPKFRRLYMDDDAKLEILLHFLRISYPFFTKAEREDSQKFLRLKDLQAKGIDIMSHKIL